MGIVNLASNYDDFKGRDVQGKLVMWLPGTPSDRRVRRCRRTWRRGAAAQPRQLHGAVARRGFGAEFRTSAAGARSGGRDADHAQDGPRPGEPGGYRRAGGSGAGPTRWRRTREPEWWRPRRAVAAADEATPQRPRRPTSTRRRTARGCASCRPDLRRRDFLRLSVQRRAAEVRGPARQRAEGRGAPAVHAVERQGHDQHRQHIRRALDPADQERRRHGRGHRSEAQGHVRALRRASRSRRLPDDAAGAAAEACRQAPADDAIFNGADDDGSGSTALLGIAKAFATGPKPKRSIVFVWHAGEEAGLLGSRYNADFPVVPLEKVAGAAQHRHDRPQS